MCPRWSTGSVKSASGELRYTGLSLRGLPIHPHHLLLKLPPLLLLLLTPSRILLLHLIDLLINLLPSLAIIPVIQKHTTRILQHLEFRAHHRKPHLNSTILVRRSLVLLLPGPSDVVVGCEGVLLELLSVLFDNGHVRFELGEASVAEFVGAGEVGVRDAVGALKVGVEGRNEAAVCVGGEVEGASADVGVFEGLDRVVDNGIGLEMLIGLLAVFVSRGWCCVG
jgi:hypothetical protein